MQKDFTTWNIQKQSIHTDGISKLYHAREIWWCASGINIGHEQDGGGSKKLRPALILKGLGSGTCLVVPLTASTQEHAYRVKIGKVGSEEASVIVSQMRVIDTKRLIEKMGFLDKEMFGKVQKTVRNMF